MRADVWIARDDTALAVAGVLFAASHIIFLVLIVLWFALKKPTSLALFRLRLGAALRGQPLPKQLPVKVPVPRSQPGS